MIYFKTILLWQIHSSLSTIIVVVITNRSNRNGPLWFVHSFWHSFGSHIVGERDSLLADRDLRRTNNLFRFLYDLNWDYAIKLRTEKKTLCNILTLIIAKFGWNLINVMKRINQIIPQVSIIHIEYLCFHRFFSQCAFYDYE